MRKQIALFKEYYDLIQEGRYYRLTDPARDEHYAAWEFAKEDGSEALLCVVASRVRTNDPPTRMLLRGLEEGALYEAEGKVYPGGALIHGGFSCSRGERGIPELDVPFREKIKQNHVRQTVTRLLFRRRFLCRGSSFSVLYIILRQNLWELMFSVIM